MFHQLLNIIKPLSDALQSSTMNVGKANKLVTAAVGILQNARQQDFDKVWNEALKMISVYTAEACHFQPRACHCVKQPSAMRDFVVTENLPSMSRDCAAVSGSCSESDSDIDKWRRLYLEVIDKFLVIIIIIIRMNIIATL